MPADRGLSLARRAERRARAEHILHARLMERKDGAKRLTGLSHSEFPCVDGYCVNRGRV
jgi:hypothetical protein